MQSPTNRQVLKSQREVENYYRMPLERVLLVELPHSLVSRPGLRAAGSWMGRPLSSATVRKRDKLQFLSAKTMAVLVIIGVAISEFDRCQECRPPCDLGSTPPTFGAVTSKLSWNTVTNFVDD